MKRGSKQALIGGIAAAVIATGAGVAFADGHDGPGGGGPGGGPGGQGARGGGIPGLLHGTFVRELRDGSGTETDALQAGTVTAVSATSISVASSDGYSATYVIDENTDEHFCRNADDAEAIAVGDRVMVQAVVDGSTSTAQRIKDRGPAPDTTD